ncbi:hypothetical protein HELRODRAFT_169697 [Helobdella robusta]|uniref:Uncharacterized protein n=1 Tax=Helobdella robusta TaxID=6412 RepID=T1F288_HELRO|nr:hypothetical protein HELRODRAFT_169697 [Helobdella robusta]ESO07979.1 hypothetical protein HELRODRAFT_169697 [Helobdella robusta]
MDSSGADNTINQSLTSSEDTPSLIGADTTNQEKDDYDFLADFSFSYVFGPNSSIALDSFDDILTDYDNMDNISFNNDNNNANINNSDINNFINIGETDEYILNIDSSDLLSSNNNNNNNNNSKFSYNFGNTGDNNANHNLDGNKKFSRESNTKDYTAASIATTYNNIHNNNSYNNNNYSYNNKYCNVNYDLSGNMYANMNITVKEGVSSSTSSSSNNNNNNSSGIGRSSIFVQDKLSLDSGGECRSLPLRRG